MASPGGHPPFTTELQDDLRKAFLCEHWHEIGYKTCQLFEFYPLDRDDSVYNTEPAILGAVAVRYLDG